MVRLAAYGGLSTAAAAYVVLSAFRQRSNFFAAAVYLSKSNASMMVRVPFYRLPGREAYHNVVMLHLYSCSGTLESS